MKVLAIFSAILAVAASYPVVKTWTLSQLSEVIELKKEPALMPYLIDAFNQIMFAAFTGSDEKLFVYVVPSPSGVATWTADELAHAMEDHNMKQEYRVAILKSYHVLKEKNAAGELTDSIEVLIPAVDISMWTAADLSEALRSPATKTELIPYLEKAYNKLNLDDSNSKQTISIATPVGLIPHKADYEFISKASKQFIKKTEKGL